MASWINIDVGGNFFNGDDAYYIYNDLKYVASVFAEVGLGNVEILNCNMPQNLALNLVMERFNLVEENIDKLHALVDYSDTYYGSSFRWSENTDMGKHLYNGVKRWINWLNDAKKHCDYYLNIAYLTDINGNYITDKNGNKILVYKELL